MHNSITSFIEDEPESIIKYAKRKLLKSYYYNFDLSKNELLYVAKVYRIKGRTRMSKHKLLNLLALQRLNNVQEGYDFAVGVAEDINKAYQILKVIKLIEKIRDGRQGLL